MDLSHATALVTGANRGLGRQFARQLLERGATVYAGARDPGSVDLPGARPVRIDITDPATVRAAAEQAGDVTLLVNNAGTSTGADLLDGDLGAIRREMETHYFGTLSVVRAFAPVIERNGGGAVLDVLSALSWLTIPRTGAYSAAKAAAWALTNGLRLELAPRGITVTALHVAFMDTDMARGVPGPKADPALVAALALDAVATGESEVLADDITRAVQGNLAGGVRALYPDLVVAGSAMPSARVTARSGV
jgi:NAD(P)-dependent dehydrogenase (short-subunit alcohol dehydrogenase family)